MKLRVGKIPYLNLLPIFHLLEGEADCSAYEFVQAYPSALNRMLREGSIDVSPSSSVEYLRGEAAYGVIKGHSISSEGPVRSILFLSRVPAEELGNKAVFVTEQSETSVALLEIILRKHFGVTPRTDPTGMPLGAALRERAAVLLIGDDALRVSCGARATSERPGTENSPRVIEAGGQRLYAYDLGELWHGFSRGKPFVYALWIYKRDIPPEKARLLERFSADLGRARDAAMDRLGEISEAAGSFLPPAETAAYWKGISYGLGPGHLEGLGLFRQHLQELGLLGAA